MSQSYDAPTPTPTKTTYKIAKKIIGKINGYQFTQHQIGIDC